MAGILNRSPYSGSIAPASDPSDGTSGLTLIRSQLYSPPDAQSFIAEQRKRHFVTSGAVAVPISGTATATAVDNLPGVSLNPDDGVLFDFLGATVIPSDTTGFLTIIDVNFTYNTTTPNAVVIPLGAPEPTTLVPRVGVSLYLPPITLLTARDLDDWARRSAGVSIFAANAQPLMPTLSVSMKNADGAAAHSFTVNLWMGFHVIHGLTGN